MIEPPAIFDVDDLDSFPVPAWELGRVQRADAVRRGALVALEAGQVWCRRRDVDGRRRGLRAWLSKFHYRERIEPIGDDSCIRAGQEGR